MEEGLRKFGIARETKVTTVCRLKMLKKRIVCLFAHFHSFKKNSYSGFQFSNLRNGLKPLVTINHCSPVYYKGLRIVPCDCTMYHRHCVEMSVGQCLGDTKKCGGVDVSSVNCPNLDPIKLVEHIKTQVTWVIRSHVLNCSAAKDKLSITLTHILTNKYYIN